MATTTRNIHLDNLKGLLIISVVLGHAFALLRNDSMEIVQSMNTIIASFHMPAFVFVAGYFAKKGLADIGLFIQTSKKYIDSFFYCASIDVADYFTLN